MTTKKKRVNHRPLKFILTTILLVCVLTACFCGIAFAWYVHTYINPSVNMDLAGLSIKQTSIVYALDSETGEYVEYEKLHGEENRIWVDFSEIPEGLRQAAVAIEDQRFYSHNGVDWKRTLGASLSFVSGGKSYGGSTITQQLIKNLSNDKDVSVKRKVREIFRSLALERAIDNKDTILEMYLNTVYFGRRAAGVQAAAQTYFGKDVKDLSLAECAAIAGITNNPSMYDPFNYPENTKSRQEIILDQMKKQGFITAQECDAAKAEKLNYLSAEQQEKQSEPYSYFTDTVLSDVINDLMEKQGYSEVLATAKVYSGGLKIYATVDPKVQSAMETIYQNEDNFPNASKNGTVPQSAMVICDKEGNLKGIIGGRGEKQGARVLNRATQSKRQPGSSIKPIAVYGPAIDQGMITPYSVLTDMPYSVIGGKAYPNNDNKTYTGQVLLKDAVARSINTISVRTLAQLGFDTSYEYLHDRMGVRSIVQSQTSSTGKVSTDLAFSPLALGGLTNGVTVREMAGAYTTFLNDGMFSGTRSYTKVENENGDVLLQNEPAPKAAFDNEKTAYYMRTILQGVTASGTATSAKVPGMATAGKTGTTQSNYDRWFCGFTPYYVGATWFGYDTPSSLSGVSGNPSVRLWTAVMQKIHEGLPNASFPISNDYKTVAICADSGKLATDACRLDPAGSRVVEGKFWPGDEPTESCDLHKEIEVCTESESTAAEFCPQTKTIALLDLTRLFALPVTVRDQNRCFTGDNAAIGSGTVVSAPSDSKQYSATCKIHAMFGGGDDEDYPDASDGDNDLESGTNGGTAGNSGMQGGNSGMQGGNSGAQGGNSGTQGGNSHSGNTTTKPKPTPSSDPEG